MSVINLHCFLRGKCGRSIRPLGVADDTHSPIEGRHIECGEHVQHRPGEDKAHDPDDNRYAQRGPLAHARSQGIHNGHVPRGQPVKGRKTLIQDTQRTNESRLLC